MATLLEKLKTQGVSKIHQAFVNEQKDGWIRCAKPNGETYGLIVNQFIARIDKGDITVVNEDAKNGIIEFSYKGSGSPF